MSDRETWERFAAAALSGMWAHPTQGVSEEAACASAYEMLSLTKQRWPDELSGNPPELAEKTCSPRCECVTQPAAGDETVTGEPDPGKGYRWLKVGETLEEGDQWLDHATRRWELTNTPGWVCKTTRHYRRRIDAAPEPSSGACQLPEETAPPANEVRSEVRSEPVPAVAVIGPGSTQAERWLPGEIGAEKVVEGGGVEELPTVGWWKGELVSRADAERLIAAARREAQEARKECERLRMTDKERDAIEFTMTNLDWPHDAAQFAILARSLGPSVTMPEHVKKSAIRGFLARHDKGGAA
jgi:hypothetical protein